MFLIMSVKEANGEYAKGKACGPDELPIEAIHMIVGYKPECIMEAFINILKTK